MTQPALFPIRTRHGALKQALGRVLATANAGASQWLYPWREEFYALKRTLLERYGERVGTDWQEITKACWGCEDCRNYGDDYYDRGRRDGFVCGGSKVYSRRYIPLSRWKLGRAVFHTPGLAQEEKPAEAIKFRGVIKHREVSSEDARVAFAQLALWFDRELFRNVAHQLFALECPHKVPF
jgi:hypothetical protein